jgi:hypothetical protein
VRPIAPRLKDRAPSADSVDMGKSVIGLCGAFGSIAGGYVPVLCGASGFSVVSLVFSFAGGVAGVLLGLRVSDV